MHLAARFFKRYNKVVLDVAAVDHERTRLEQENADLRQLLKNFLDGIRWERARGSLVELPFSTVFEFATSFKQGRKTFAAINH